MEWKSTNLKYYTNCTVSLQLTYGEQSPRLKAKICYLTIINLWFFVQFKSLTFVSVQSFIWESILKHTKIFSHTVLFLCCCLFLASSKRQWPLRQFSVMQQRTHWCPHDCMTSTKNILTLSVKRTYFSYISAWNLQPLLLLLMLCYCKKYSIAIIWVKLSIHSLY